MMLAIFSSACLPSICQQICSHLLPIFYKLGFIVRFQEFRILNTSPLSDKWFANIFSHSSFLFILLILSFKDQTFLILVKSTLLGFCLMDCTFWCCYLKTHHQTQGHAEFSYFLLKSVIVLCLSLWPILS